MLSWGVVSLSPAAQATWLSFMAAVENVGFYEAIETPYYGLELLALDERFAVQIKACRQARDEMNRGLREWGVDLRVGFDLRRMESEEMTTTWDALEFLCEDNKQLEGMREDFVQTKRALDAYVAEVKKELEKPLGDLPF